jgi:ribosome-binding factor A
MSNRLLRVNELLQREISAYLHSKYSGEAVRLTITGADVTGDLREAKIYFSALGDEEDIARAGRWLKAKVPEIRSIVAKNVVMRHVPLLTFLPDITLHRAVRVEELLDQLDREAKEGGA